MQSFKGDEIKLTISHLLLPLLFGTVSKSAFETLCKFHRAFCIFLQDTVTLDEAQLAHEYLKSCHTDLIEWNETFLYINFHDMLHLLECLLIFSADSKRTGFPNEVASGKTGKGMFLHA